MFVVSIYVCGCAMRGCQSCRISGMQPQVTLGREGGVCNLASLVALPSGGDSGIIRCSSPVGEAGGRRFGGL